MTWPRTKRPKALWVGQPGGLKPNGHRIESKKLRRLKPRSSSYSARMRIYGARVKAFLRLNPFCAVYPTRPATEVHHRAGRSGRLLLWEPGWLAVSQEGHVKIHGSPSKARRLGWLLPIGCWNDYERAVAAMASSKQSKDNISARSEYGPRPPNPPRSNPKTN